MASVGEMTLKIDGSGFVKQLKQLIAELKRERIALQKLRRTPAKLHPPNVGPSWVQAPVKKRK